MCSINLFQTEEDAKKSISLEEYSPENQLMYRWFQGKCLIDRTWCWVTSASFCCEMSSLNFIQSSGIWFVLWCGVGNSIYIMNIGASLLCSILNRAVHFWSWSMGCSTNTLTGLRIWCQILAGPRLIFICALGGFPGGKVDMKNKSTYQLHFS